MPRPALALFIAACAAVVVPGMALAAPGQPPSGLWREQGSTVVLRFLPCGAKLCGLLEASARLQADPAARDDRNPDPALRSRPLKGVPMLDGLVPVGDGWSGHVYIPSTGHAYPVTLRRENETTLTATGCVAPLLCHTQVLLRAP